MSKSLEETIFIEKKMSMSTRAGCLLIAFSQIPVLIIVWHYMVPSANETQQVQMVFSSKFMLPLNALSWGALVMFQLCRYPHLTVPAGIQMAAAALLFTPLQGYKSYLFLIIAFAAVWQGTVAMAMALRAKH